MRGLKLLSNLFLELWQRMSRNINKSMRECELLGWDDLAESSEVALGDKKSRSRTSENGQEEGWAKWGEACDRRSKICKAVTSSLALVAEHKAVDEAKLERQKKRQKKATRKTTDATAAWSVVKTAGQE
jgi:hypothetical protein